MKDLQLVCNPQCPWCGFSPVNIEADHGFLQPCSSCGKDLLVCARFEEDDTVLHVWLATPTGQRVTA